MSTRTEVPIIAGLIVTIFAASPATGAEPPNATPAAARSAEELMNAATRDLEVAVREHQAQIPFLQPSARELLQPTAKEGQQNTAMARGSDGGSEWQNILRTHNGQVDAWETYFAVGGRTRLLTALLRVAPHRDHVQAVLAQMGLPRGLMMVAFVESEFVPTAVSPKGATGPWQFIRATAARYGLQSGAWHDERTDFEKSTFAAARYLSHLHDVFGDWLLALAAYNAGEDTVAAAVVKGKTRDFWRLSHMGLLPRETQEYVPEILGALGAWRTIYSDAVHPTNEKESSSFAQRSWVYALSAGN